MPSTKQTILLTGAAGRIGSNFLREFGDRYKWVLADHVTPTVISDGADVITFDVADLDACRSACAEVNTVVHLAADPSPEADFYGSLLDNNIKGTYNMFRAAKDAGCQRVIFASSVHAIFAYPPDSPVPDGVPVRPANMYGATKTFGESVGSAFAYGEGLSSICVRIGAYHNDWIKSAATPDNLCAYVSPRDLNQLLVKCIETPDIDYAVVIGLSNNRQLRMSLDATRTLLNYQPVDDGFEVFAEYIPKER
jgi:nucleoside-diphosphate-sugar epimerase